MRFPPGFDLGNRSSMPLFLWLLLTIDFPTKL
jgi:hypothetical protein